MGNRMTPYKAYYLSRQSAYLAIFIGLIVMVLALYAGLNFLFAVMLLFVTFYVCYFALKSLLYNTVPDKAPENVSELSADERNMELLRELTDDINLSDHNYAESSESSDDPDLRDTDSSDLDTSVRDAGFNSILQSIGGGLNPQWVKGENDLESQVFNLINNSYPGQTKRNTGHSAGVADIVVDGRYGLVVGVIDREDALYSLVGRIAFVADNYEKIAAVLFVDRYLRSKLDLDPFLSKLEDYRVTALVKEGFIERGPRSL